MSRAKAARRLPAAPRRSLHMQFVRLLLLPLTVAFLLAAAGTVLVGYRAEMSAQATQRNDIADIYAHSLRKPLWDCDSTTSHGIVEALAHLPTVAAVALDDVCADRTLSSGAAIDAPRREMLARTVMYRDELQRDFTVGQLRIQFHPTSIRSTAMAVLWRYLAIFVVMLAVMLAGAALVFRRIVGQPLAGFRAAIDAHRPADDVQPSSAFSQAPRRNDELTDVMCAYDDLMQELHWRFKRQAALAHCAHTLLATSATDERPLVSVLDSVLQAVAAQRIYLVENTDDAHDAPAMTLTALAGAPLPDTPAVQAYCDAYARWRERFEAREQIVGNVADLPASEQAVLNLQAVQSLAAVPVWGQNHWYGFLCVHDLRRERRWSDDERIFLQTVADMIGAYQENDSHTRELAAVINKLRDNEKALMEIARRDPLTGLGNRIVLEEELSRAILRAQRAGHEGYVLLIDLDGFKPINDNYGHALGDFVLQEVARRLRTAVRRTDTVTRLGGDEFVVIIESGTLPCDLATLTAKLADAIAAPLLHDGHTLIVGASIGAARFPSDGTSSVPLLAQADQAMYAAKHLARQA